MTLYKASWFDLIWFDATCELSYCFQPKLSSAKSRLNVENFIAACRKFGVAEVKSTNNTSMSCQPKLCSFSNWDAAEFEFKSFSQF